MRFKVVNIEANPEAALPIERAVLEPLGALLVGAGSTKPDAIVAAAQDAHVLLSEGTPVGAALLARLPRLRAVVSYSIGLDHIDLDAATAQGIVVAHTPGFCADEVSSHVLLFVLACARRLLPLDRQVRGGWWPDGRALEAELLPMGGLRGETLGLLGFGAIARMAADKARAFGMQIIAHDPFADPALFARHAVEAVGLDELLGQSDYLSLHTPLLPATRGLLDAARLRLMKPSAFLINTSRGAVIDESALLVALREGWIAGAALDVFAEEPPPPDHPLFKLENLIVTPHSAFCSDASYRRVREMAAEAAACVLRGEWPPALANPAVRGRSRLDLAKEAG
jgi:D-3-phosphoglycerate dehydrogenase